MNPAHEIHVNALHTYPLCATCKLKRVTDSKTPCDCCLAERERDAKKKAAFIAFLSGRKRQQDIEQQGLF